MNKEIFFLAIVPTFKEGHLNYRAIEPPLNRFYSSYKISSIVDESIDNTEQVSASIYAAKIDHPMSSIIGMCRKNLMEMSRLVRCNVTAVSNFKEFFQMFEKYLKPGAKNQVEQNLALNKTADKEPTEILVRGIKAASIVLVAKGFLDILKQLILSIIKREPGDVKREEKNIDTDSNIVEETIEKMHGDILFSVIIPTYNRKQFITKAIESVINQKYTNYEIIIVDDGSNDGTEDLLMESKIDKLQYFKILNSERAFARNYGMTKAKGDYITFLDSDDILFSNYLSNSYESIKKYNYPDFLHVAYVTINADTGKRIRKFKIKNDNIFCLVKGNPLSCLGVFLKREVAQSYHFNEDRNLTGSEDWELWLRLAANFGLKTDERISGALLMHKSRSVLNYPEERLLLRKNLALKYAFEDKKVNEIYGPYKGSMGAYCDSYISLHLALSGKNSKAIRYLLMAFRIYPLSFFNMRTFAIFKHVLINICRLRNN